MERTITREQAAGIAHTIATFRPEWNLRMVTDEIMKLRGTLPAIASHALAVASDWGNKAPIRITQIPMATPNRHTEKPGDKSACVWCHRSEYACRRAQANTGLDPHTYRPSGSATVAPVAMASGDDRAPLPGV